MRCTIASNYTPGEQSWRVAKDVWSSLYTGLIFQIPRILTEQTANTYCHFG
jgi:hypothetical protein